MSRFEGLQQLKTSEIGRLMTKRAYRGDFVAVALVAGMYQLLAERLQTDVMFASCPPGLVQRYLTLGLRVYDGCLVSTPDGVEVPLVGIFPDRTYPAATGSVLVPFIDAVFGQGRRPPLPLAPFAKILNADTAPVELRPEVVRRNLLRHCEPNGKDGHNFLRSLRAETVLRLADKGITMRVPADALLTAKGRLAREVFVVLEGAVEVRDGARRLARLGRGEVIGATAFFGASGRRRASIYACADTEVLIVRRRVVDELRVEHPSCAADIVFELARGLADDVHARLC